MILQIKAGMLTSPERETEREREREGEREREREREKHLGYVCSLKRKHNLGSH